MSIFGIKILECLLVIPFISHQTLSTLCISLSLSLLLLTLLAPFPSRFLKSPSSSLYLPSAPPFHLFLLSVPLSRLFHLYTPLPSSLPLILFLSFSLFPSPLLCSTLPACFQPNSAYLPTSSSIILPFSPLSIYLPVFLTPSLSF